MARAARTDNALWRPATMTPPPPAAPDMTAPDPVRQSGAVRTAPGFAVA